MSKIIWDCRSLEFIEYHAMGKSILVKARTLKRTQKQRGHRQKPFKIGRAGDSGGQRGELLWQGPSWRWTPYNVLTYLCEEPPPNQCIGPPNLSLALKIGVSNSSLAPPHQHTDLHFVPFGISVISLRAAPRQAWKSPLQK